MLAGTGKVDITPQGYAEDTRRVGRAAEQVVVEHSLALLRGVQRMPISD